jgi:hypothetical protein
MRIQTVVLLVVAVVLGTAGSRVTKRLLFSQSGTGSAVEERVTVFAAKQPISAGTVLREPDRWFEERTVLKAEEPEKAVNRLYHLRGRRLVGALDAQAIITTDQLADEEQEGAALLKKEGRQPVDFIVASLGDALFPPDARVDVLPGRRNDASRTARPLVASHLPLLAVRPIDKHATLATLAVTSEEEQQLRRAVAEGGLQLRLSVKR